jgi:hypothetical protein
MANPQPAAAAGGQEEQQGQGSWMRSILNGLLIFFAINAASSFLGGKFGAQKNVTSTDGIVKPATNQGAAQIPALWNLGTKMVLTKRVY